MSHRIRQAAAGRRRRTFAAVALAAALALAVPTAATAVSGDAGPGGSGVGDPYYPLAGNSGYDVRHYGLDLDYSPGTGILKGTAVITATARKALSSFHLDLDGLTVASVLVNGRAASYSRSGGELTVTPKKALRAKLPFVVVVRYSGIPQSVDDAGFLRTDDGTLVAGQPRVASTWFPVNDHPSDKAKYTIRITVPRGVEAISNGALVSRRDHGTRSTWLWNVDEPMASYLATATIGQFDVTKRTVDGIRYWDALDPDLSTPNGPHTGAALAYSGRADDAYMRLQRTITVDAAQPSLSLWADRDIEEGWDFAFVEVAPTGTDEWTTVPDDAGLFTQDAGNAGCADLLAQHPFLAHYLAEQDDGTCAPEGTTGAWWATTGTGDGWEQWSFDLSAWAGQSVDVAITYLTDYTYSLGGLAIDDIAAAQGTTSFEADADPWDGWAVAGAPEGSPGNAVDWTIGAEGAPTFGEVAAASLARQPEIVSFLAGWFGDYPFDELGGIVDDYDELGFALENQTRPVYAKEFFTDQVSGDAVVVHEIAHQWYGDSVSVRTWADIWLNEGFATYAEWLWSEHEGAATPQEYFDYYMAAIPADDEFWSVEIGDPGPDDLFDGAVYVRGAMTLQALRTQIGDEAFGALLPAWHARKEGGNGSIVQFIALAEKVSGQELDDFFDTWLYSGEKPEDASASQRRSAEHPSTPKIRELSGAHGD